MIKIIREPIMYRVRCTCCLTLLEFQNSDIEYYKSDDDFGYVIKCPSCGYRTKVKHKYEFLETVEPVYKEENK